MRVVIREPGAEASDEVVLPLDRLRDRLEERLLSALEAWEVEKKHLEEVVARAEAKEQEFREVADDVKRRLDALDLVTGMAREAEAEFPIERRLPAAGTPPMLSAGPAEKSMEPVNGAATASEIMRIPFATSSRPLFTPAQRARAGKLSILQ